MNVKYVPVILITGYLGSGKTTLLNRILTNAEGIKFAVIVNDIGEVNIDASLIQKGGIVGQNGSDDLVALQNGCICCTLKADLMQQIAELIEKDCFDYIAIEASGVCEPAPIANTILAMQNMNGEHAKALPRLDCIVTVTDALRLKTEFGCASSLINNNIEEEDIENLIIEQIEFCNLILLNKVDEVSNHEAKEIKVILKTLQPVAPIIETNYADIPLKDILYTGLFDFEKTATSAIWIKEIEDHTLNVEISEGDSGENHHEHHHDHHHEHEHGEAEEYGIGTWVYFRRRPFDLDKFDRFVAQDWPANIIRSKGLIYFSQSPDMSYIFEQVGVQKNLKEAGLWYASAPEEELRIMMENDPALRRDWDAEYGDRMIKLVFIGRNIDRDKLKALLDKC